MVKLQKKISKCNIPEHEETAFAKVAGWAAPELVELHRLARSGRRIREALWIQRTLRSFTYAPHAKVDACREELSEIWHARIDEARSVSDARSVPEVFASCTMREEVGCFYSTKSALSSVHEHIVAQ